MDDRTQPTHWPTPEDPLSRPVLATATVSLTPGTRGAPRPRDTRKPRAATPTRRRIRPFMSAAPTGRRSTRSPTWTASRLVLTSTPRRRFGSGSPGTPIH